MAFLLVTWEADNSVSVIKRTAKVLLSLEGEKVKFRWPRKGVYTGTIIDSLDSKKEMDDMAKDMAATEQQKSKKGRSKLPRTTPPPLSSPPPPLKKAPAMGRGHKQTAKQASIVASNATAKSLFAETDKLRKLQEEVLMLRKQLEGIDQENSMDVSDISVSDTDEETISPYEAAANRRKQENLQLIKELGIHHLSTQDRDKQSQGRSGISTGLSSTKSSTKSKQRDAYCPVKHKHVPTAPQDVAQIEKADLEKTQPTKVELVRGMGIHVNGAMLATALRRAKRQPTRLLRILMVELFTTDQLRCSTVRGKKGTLPALDPDIMNAILCFTMAKGEEWGLPVTEEALVRQANEKCYQYRKN